MAHSRLAIVPSRFNDSRDALPRCDFEPRWAAEG
jgi:hypothetical protein